MDKLLDWHFSKIFGKMRPSSFKKFINLGFDCVFDKYFFRKYFRVYGIPKTLQPDFPQLIGWELRKEQEIDLSQTPWDIESQNLHWITGDNNNGYTVYYDNYLIESVEETLRMLVNTSINTKLNLFSSISIGYMGSMILQNTSNIIKTVIFIRYCPYDAITIGYYLPEIDIWEFSNSIHYYGQTMGGVRSGKGVIKFNNGFELFMSNWPDFDLIKKSKNKIMPFTPANFVKLLGNIMKKYVAWGEKINYFFDEN